MASEAEKARRIAKQYVDLVEALRQEGMPEGPARAEARIMTVMESLAESAKLHQDGPKCPLCGRAG